MPVVRAADDPQGLERAAYVLLLAFAAALPFSIFVAETLLTVTGLLWLWLVVRGAGDDGGAAHVLAAGRVCGARRSSRRSSRSTRGSA